MNEERIHHAPKGLKVFPEEGRKAQPSIRGARSGLRFLSLSYSLSPAEGGVDLQPPVTMSPRLEEEFPPLFLQVDNMTPVRQGFNGVTTIIHA